MNIQLVPTKKNRNPHVTFLCNTFFFKCLSPVIFENHYYTYFNELSFLRDAVVQRNGAQREKMLFIRKGAVKLEFTGSVMSIHNLIKDIIERIKVKNKKISEHEIDEMKTTLLDDPEILRIKNKDSFIKTEFNKNQTFDLFLLNEGEIIGVEEFYIDVPYLTNGYVMLDNTEVFAVREDDLKCFLQQEMEVKTVFNVMATRKVVSFIKRLHNVKRSLIKKVLSTNESINKEHLNVLEKFDIKSLIQFKGKRHKRNKTFTEIDVTSVEMKRSNEKLDKEKLLHELTTNRLNKIKSISQSQEMIIDNNSLEATETNNKTSSFMKSIFSNSILIKQNVVPPIPKDFAVKENTTEAFLVTKQSKPKDKVKTIIKLRQGHFTADSIENEVNLISQQYIGFQNANTKYVNKDKTYIERSDYPHKYASSSHLSFVDLSKAKESVYSNGNSVFNETYSRYLPEIKSTFNANQSKFMQNQMFKKSRYTNQEVMNLKINSELIAHSISQKNLKYGNIAQKIKNYYEHKKQRGYSSIVNLEHNAFRNVNSKKNRFDSCKSFQQQIIKKLRVSAVNFCNSQKHILAISQEVF